MHNISLKFENEISQESLEALFDTLASILPEDLYSENKMISSDGVESDYNVMHHVAHDYHCYEMPVTRALTVQEGKTIYEVLDQAIEGDYCLEMSADSTELQNRYKFNSFEGSIQEGNLD